ncbi:hypothetical protein QS257_07535 [Terrilactibacillus sp. S3-3]|nr:hypothetical protein QS257_07535 [Terrilactibacillus sp. S3-3]
MSPLSKEFGASIKQLGIQLTVYNASGKSLYFSGKSGAPAPPSSPFPSFYQKKKYVVYTDKLADHHRTIGYIQFTAPFTPLKGLVLLDFFLFIAGLSLLYYHDRLIKRYSGPVTEAALMTEKKNAGGRLQQKSIK